jgi:eukaryotic-like serine/threonine-protein kinase
LFWGLYNAPLSMAINPGTKLGPYAVSDAIGAGGMGEVYRAHDPRLNRDIAIKVLPSSFSEDPQRLHRFKQEALAVAALNHPNILAVYDIGSQDDGSPYIVSELLEGSSLRDRLRTGPLSLRKSIDYAIQMARGLAAAHDKGIVHRDLKPENIFITHDGRVKLLDFGLAKLTQATPASGEAETRTIQSDAGTVVGTAGYMSPEQIRGKPADGRSDLFALGAVLYEMISGKRAFHGDTTADTMSAILQSDLPELTETNRNVPPALERIVRHCVEKNPEERFHSAHDVAFDLETLTSISGTSVATGAVSKTTRRTLSALFATAALVGTAFVLVGKYATGPIQAPRFHRITYERGSVLSARFAADGQSVVYDAAWEGKAPHLFSTPASIPEPRALDLENAHLFAVSRTGEAALGLGGRVGSHLMVIGATLARSPLGGGAPREMLEDVMAADWAPNGNLAVARYTGGHMRLEYPIGKVLYESSGWVSDLRVSPTGDKIAFLDHPTWPDDRGWVAVVDLAGNKTILSREWETEDGIAWAPGGKEIWFAATAAGNDRSLFAVSLSGKQRSVLSVPSSLRLFDIYPDGRVLLSAGHERVGMIGTTVGDDRGHDLSWSGWTIASDISPDSKWVLFDEQSEFSGLSYTVAMRTVDGSPPIKLGDGTISKYTPDGKWVTAVIPSQPNHFALLPTGAGEPKDVPIAGLDSVVYVTLMADSNLILEGSVRGHALRCYSRSLDGGPLKAVTPEGTNLCRCSPDSHHVVAVSNAGGLSVYQLDGGNAHSLPDTDSMAPIRWVDNHSILAYRSGELPGSVFQIDVVSGKQRLIKKLAPADRAGVSQLQNVAASSDGHTLAYSYQQVLYELFVVEGLK